MKILQIPQGSTEWMMARCGVVTASEADALLTPEFAIRKGEGVQTYIYQKLAEKIMGYKADAGFTWEMNQGNVTETLALPWYEFAHDAKIDRVGFCLSDDGRIGCSPDGLLGEDGGIEVKSPQPPKHIQYLLAGDVPKAYRVQVQFSLYVTGRKWWKFLSFHPFLSQMLIHVEPDPAAQQAIAEALERFFKEFDAAHAKLAPMIASKGRQ
jgi:hypothetical protein